MEVNFLFILLFSCKRVFPFLIQILTLYLFKVIRSEVDQRIYKLKVLHILIIRHYAPMAWGGHYKWHEVAIWRSTSCVFWQTKTINKQWWHCREWQIIGFPGFLYLPMYFWWNYALSYVFIPKRLLVCQSERKQLDFKLFSFPRLQMFNSLSVLLKKVHIHSAPRLRKSDFYFWFLGLILDVS